MNKNAYKRMLKVMVRSIYYCLYAAFGDNLHRLSCVWNNGSSEENKKPVHDSTQSFIEERLAKGLVGLIELVGLSGMIKSSEADEKRLFATR